MFCSLIMCLLIVVISWKKLIHSTEIVLSTSDMSAQCGLRGWKNWPALFPGRMSYKATKPGLALSGVYLSMFYCIVVYLGPFLCIVSFRCYVFCLLVVLPKLSLLAKWLARKTPLGKPNRGEGIVSRKPRLKSVHDFLGLLYCFIVLLCICVVSCPYVIYYPTAMAWYSLFVLKVPLNPKQASKQVVIWVQHIVPEELCKANHKTFTVVRFANYRLPFGEIVAATYLLYFYSWLKTSQCILGKVFRT